MRMILVQVKWKDNIWYPGTVTVYNPDKHQHKVLYDDGDVRWYDFNVKTWELYPPPLKPAASGGSSKR